MTSFVSLSLRGTIVFDFGKFTIGNGSICPDRLSGSCRIPEVLLLFETRVLLGSETDVKKVVEPRFSFLIVPKSTVVK